MFLGTLANDNDYDIGGDIYSIGDNRLVIEGISNTIEAPDIYFILGTNGGKPNKDGILLPYPLQGIDNKTPFQNKTSDGEQTPILLTLPSSIKVPDLKWMSVWTKSLDKIMGQVAFTSQAKTEDENESNFPNNGTHGKDENGKESESLYDKGENSLSDHDNLSKEKNDKNDFNEENSGSNNGSVDTDISFNGDGDTNQKVDKHDQDHQSNHQDAIQNDPNQVKGNNDQETHNNMTSSETNSNLSTISDGQNNIESQETSEKHWELEKSGNKNQNTGSDKKDKVSQPGTEFELIDETENNGNVAGGSKDGRTMNHNGIGQNIYEASTINEAINIETSNPHSYVYLDTTQAQQLDHENDESSVDAINTVSTSSDGVISKKPDSEIKGSMASTDKPGFINDIETSTNNKNIKDSYQGEGIIETQTKKHGVDTNANINMDNSQESRPKDQEFDSDGGPETIGTVHHIEATTEATKDKTMEDSNQGNGTITTQTGELNADKYKNLTKEESQGTRPKDQDLDLSNDSETSGNTHTESNSIYNSTDVEDLAGTNGTKSDQNSINWTDGQKSESNDISDTNGAINLSDGNENVDRIQDNNAKTDHLDGQIRTNKEKKDDNSQTNIFESSNGEQEPESGTNVLINGRQVGASVTDQNEQTNNTSKLLDQKTSNDQDSADKPNDTKTTGIVDQATLNNTKLNGQINSESNNNSDASGSNSNSKNENDDLYASNDKQNISEADKFDDNENSIDSEKDQNTNKTQENQIPSGHVTNSGSDKTHLPSNTNSNANSISNLEDKTLSSTSGNLNNINTNQTQEEKETSLGTHNNTSETVSKLPDFKETIPDSHIKSIQEYNNLEGQDSNGFNNNSDQDKENEINMPNTNGEQSMTKDHPENPNVIETGFETFTVKTNQKTNNVKSNDGSDWFDNWIPGGDSSYESTGNPIKTSDNGHVNAGNR